MSTFSQWLLLFRVHNTILFRKASLVARHSRLMTGTIVAFLITYAIASFWLFSHGFEYVSKLPAAGSLLSDRLISVMFFCFMLMLIFSVAITTYISLYRNRDTSWLLSLPVSHRAIFLWKSFEAAMFSSWGLLFILAPLLVAFARIRDVSPLFYFKALAILIPFLILASTIGTLLMVICVRYLSKRQLQVALTMIALALIGSAAWTALQGQKAAEDSGLSAALTFQRVLQHTNIAVNRAMPSTWLAASIIDWTRPYRHFSTLLYPSLLVSNCLMAGLALCLTGKHIFYSSWNRTIQRAALAANRKQNNSDPGELNGLHTEFTLFRFGGRPLAAISKKDFRTFFREPAQWIQFSIVFGLLAIYASGLRQMNGDISQPRDLYIVAFLNLAVCALALSTLTTRFVFPQFSLEGRRLWILAMSPLRLPTIVNQKFVTSTFSSGIIVILILLISGYNLQLGWGDSLFFACAIALLAIGLNALAVGLGVLFPNLEESNAARIVSGFGGTLCLVASFIFILSFIMLLVYTRWSIFSSNEINPCWFRETRGFVGAGTLLILTFIVTAIPLTFAKKKIKRLEILSIL